MEDLRIEKYEQEELVGSRQNGEEFGTVSNTSLRKEMI